jgi:hypothetical protein
MLVRNPVRAFALAVAITMLLSDCQGNIGSGSGLSIPQAPSQGQPAGPQQPASRERVLEGAVYMNLASPLPDLPLPTIGGFGIDIALGTAPPSPSPAPSTSPSAPAKGSSKRARTSAIGRHAYRVAALTPSDESSPLASPAPTSSPSAAPASPAAAASTGAVTHLSDVPSASASGSPAATTSGSPAATASTKPGHHGHLTVAAGPKITTKIVAYPDEGDAPAAPTPEPTGAVQTFPVRKPLLRGYILPMTDVPIYGLGAVRFLLPKTELTPGRGYTIAIFTAAKHFKGKLLEYDTSPVVSATSVASSYDDDPIVFKKSIGYEIVIYADEGLATPVPVPSGYPQSGANPFYTPAPPGSQQPGQGGQPGQPGQAGYGTPPPPGYTPTPYASASYFH